MVGFCTLKLFCVNPILIYNVWLRPICSNTYVANTLDLHKGYRRSVVGMKTTRIIKSTLGEHFLGPHLSFFEVSYKMLITLLLRFNKEGRCQFMNKI